MAVNKTKKKKKAAKGDPTKLLTRAYILAFALIALVSMSGHYVTAGISAQQKVSSEVAYQINKQRTEMQQILSYAPHYDRLGDALDLRFIYQSLREVEDSHNFILNYMEEKNLLGKHKSNALRRVYYDPPYTAADHINKYLKDANTFLNANEQSDGEERKRAIEDMDLYYNSFIKPALELATDSYQTEILEKINGYQRLQHAGIALILLVLLAEAVFIFRPLIARIENYNRMMKKYALEDALTGLSNRRAFINRAVIELKRGIRENMPVAVALMDLDHFKSVNDTYGHDVGDLVLKHFSKILKTSFRAGDVVGRIGGEEFAIVLPKTQQHYAHQILEKLCRRVENTPCPYEDEDGNPQELDYTVSVGFVGVTEINSTDIDLYLKQSDEALYHTKENGRNGVTCYNNLNSPDPDTSQSENVTPLARPQKQDAQH